jgi:beta-glucosidase
MTQAEKLSLVSGDVLLDDNGTGVSTCVGHLPAIPRLQLPALCFGDGAEGVGNGMTRVTEFPAPIAGASTWDIALLKAFGAALGSEQAGKGRNVVLAPTINILRSPKWGRAAETLSEDPYLTSQLGVAIVEGIQTAGVIATPKHFAANNQETLRLGNAPDYRAIDVRVSDRALHEIYFPAFEAAVEDAHAGSVMCAYNRVNSVYACENPTLYEALRGDWKFDGFVVSDWYFAHRSTVPAALAGLDVSMPGRASPFGFADFYGEPLHEALNNNRVPESRLNDMVANVLRPMIRAGLMRRAPQGGPDADVRSEAHRQLARDMAIEGTVLLKNEKSALPFGPQIRSLAIIGDDAGPHVHTTENYGGFVNSKGILVSEPLSAITARAGGGVNVVYAAGTLGVGALPLVPAAVLESPAHEKSGLTASWYGSGDFAGAPIRTTQSLPTLDALPTDLPKVWSVRWHGYLLPPATGRYRFSLSGSGEIALNINGRRVVSTSNEQFTSVTHGVADLRAGEPTRIEIEYSMAPAVSKPALHVGWQPPDHLIDAAAALAGKADAAVVFVADDVSEGGDRTDLELPGDQDALIAAVADANPNTIVVTHTVGPVLMPWLPKVAAVISAWYPGEMAGDAIAAILFGDVNPSGKLPMTFPATEKDGPLTSAERFPGVRGEVRYEEGLLVGYRYYDAAKQKPLFPFGFGLSYTTFGIDGVRVSRTERGTIVVEGTVTNTGTRRGAEVVQVYVGFPPSAGEPPWQLKAFDRLVVDPGQRYPFHFDIGRKLLSIWDSKTRRWTLPNGVFKVRVSNSSAENNDSMTVELGDR